ncbi:hypothetical protein AAGS40_30080 (plasmid) [Paraburkholderia sp. PREW-6R]|uniref:hypothetical protein n=1 Tax=Paraburkholderia sp. PREW-6R TaxID=3141544 RepID=UPI0031F4CD44
MKRTSHSVRLFWAASILIASPCTFPQTPNELLAQRLLIWQRYAPVCLGSPSKWKDPPASVDPMCNDGDMNLFSGLLCAAGVEEGCRAVKAAFANSGPQAGRWYRSPRRRNDPSIDAAEAKGGVASFSPDMALGAQLYLATTRDTATAQAWLNWLNRHRPCLAGKEPTCNFPQDALVLIPNVRGWPRFCTDDAPSSGNVGRGCTMRPGDLADLAFTRYYLLSANQPSLSCTADLSSVGDLGDYFSQLVDVDKLVAGGLPRLLDISCGLAPELNRLSGLVNRPGYSQHLVAVEIFLYRKLGVKNPLIDQTAKLLSDKQPKNPFFRYLAEGPTDSVRDLVLAQCPSTDAEAAASPRSQWAWERDDAEQAWKKSSMWDCIFMAKLLYSGLESTK